MKNKLHYSSVSHDLLNCLRILMAAPEFNLFRLVGGTALSLYRGHRISVDIDLFTDAEYGSIDFDPLHNFLVNNYSYVDTAKYNKVGMGRSYYIGENKQNCIKLDLFYTDEFMDDVLEIDNIRMASVEEIIAMKMDVVARGGRKKDFWDFHELKDNYSLKDMLSLHEQRYPFTHDPELILNNFTDFTGADEDFDPICLKGKDWDLVKSDLVNFAKDR